MQLKDFKSGVEYVVKSTNQRLSEPEPLMVQVAADSSLSLLSGNEREVFIWRTGAVVGSPRRRFGIPSKMLTQATKALKGTKLSVSLSVADDGLIVSTSSGGTIKLPMVDEPVLLRPWSDTGSPVMSLREGTLARWSDAFTTAFSPTEDSVQFDTDGRVCATDGYIMFDTHGTLDSKLPVQRHVRASFWNALRARETDATLTFSESGLRVRVGEYEALTAFLEGQRVYPNMKEFYFPAGVTPNIYAVVDRKMLIGQVKAVASTTANEQVFLSLPASEQSLVIKGIQTGANVVMNIRRKGKGWGTIECSAKYLVGILNAIGGKEVIVSWRENVTHPVGVRDAGQQHEWFLLAPVVRT